MTERDKILSEAFNALKKNNFNGIVILPTGTGKGKLMIDVAKHLKKQKILYTCNTTLLRDKMFVDELRKWDASYLEGNIERLCYQTACKKEGQKYQLLLADEFDAALTPEYIKTITNNNFEHKVLVSATLDAAKLKMAKKIAPIVYEKSPKDLIETGVLNGINFYFISYNLSPYENILYLQYNKDFQRLLNQFQDNKIKQQLEQLKIRRKHFLSNLKTSAEVTKWLIRKIKPKNEKILIFCGLSEQADSICTNSYHSINNNAHLLEQFDKGIIKEIAVVQKVDRGLNIDSVRHIIHESTGKSKTRGTQRNGRGMRLKPEEFLNVYYNIPTFLHPLHGRKPTIIESWVKESLVDYDITKAKIIDYEKLK